jgi:4-aminobutyrate aminotransferase-like enzyme
MRERGVLLGADGPFHNVIKIRPPMVISERDGDVIVEEFERAVAQLPR